jgi:CBS domain-containing protein
MKVSDVMTRGAECTRPEATLQEAAEQMRQLDVGSLPVCGNDKLVGMITDRDIAVRSTATGDNPMLEKVNKVMTPTVVYCYEDQDASEAAEIMKEKQIRRLVVLNRDKRLVGIVSLGDLAVETQDDRMAGDALEAISEPAAPARR